MNPVRAFTLICIVLACGLAEPATAQQKAPPTTPEAILFVVARGEPDACGPGCSEWIAAEGMFDKDVERRFRDLLLSLNGRKLPIFFNSLGGIIGEARAIGKVLREFRMVASVGKTIPEGCRTMNASGESCRRIMRSSWELKAQLRTTSSICHSACVYALIGASFRKVPADSRVGIHASRQTAASIALSLRPGAPTAEQIYSARKRYVLEMGVDPKLVDMADKIPSHSMHILSRKEIAQFGIETRGIYETGWMPYEDRRPSKPMFMLKAITQAKGVDSKEYRTTNLRVTCAVMRPGTRLVYLRELASNETGVSTVVRVAVGNSVLVLQSEVAKGANDVRSVIADQEFVRKALANGSIVFIESFSPQNAQEWSREVKLSTTGLEQALDTSLKSCGAR